MKDLLILAALVGLAVVRSARRRDESELWRWRREVVRCLRDPNCRPVERVELDRDGRDLLLTAWP